MSWMMFFYQPNALLVGLGSLKSEGTSLKEPAATSLGVDPSPSFPSPYFSFLPHSLLCCLLTEAHPLQQGKETYALQEGSVHRRVYLQKSQLSKGKNAK